MSTRFFDETRIDKSFVPTSCFTTRMPSLDCPPEFSASAFFHHRIGQFVSSAQSPEFVGFSGVNARVVALVWVYQTKIADSPVMGEHTHVDATKSRPAFDDRGATRTSLPAAHRVCDLFILAIQSAGPARLGSPATYADSLSQRIAEARHGSRRHRISARNLSSAAQPTLVTWTTPA